MQNFTFCNPTKIIFGKDSLPKMQKEVPQGAKVMILFGGNSAKKTGTLGEVKEALQGHDLIEFGGIEANPTYETLMKAVGIIKEEKVDFLIAVGGGSVIDGVKFVAAAVYYKGDPWKIPQTYGSKVTKAIPFGTVLTLPATGSEMNNGAVITRAEWNSKLPFRSPCCYPKFSILDPEKTYTLPKSQVANGLLDAFSHVIEQYLTYPVGGLLQDRFAESIIKTLIEIAPKALAENDYETRANLMLCATYALNGVICSGVPQDWSTHMIGHELTALYHIDHARTLAIVMPALMNKRRDVKREKLIQYAERIWNITTGTDDEKIDTAIEKTIGFFHSLGIPTHLKDYDLGVDAVDTVIEQLDKHGMNKLGEDAQVDLQMSREILMTAL